MIITIIIRTIKSPLSLSLFIKANAEADPDLMVGGLDKSLHMVGKRVREHALLGKC